LAKNTSKVHFEDSSNAPTLQHTRAPSVVKQNQSNTSLPRVDSDDDNEYHFNQDLEVKRKKTVEYQDSTAVSTLEVNRKTYMN
jgi:hypothetical protein